MARVLAAVLALLSSLALAEIATRQFLTRPDFERIPARPSIVPHPTRGYAYAPSYPGFTNALGMRDEPIDPGERVDILAVGDSFTVGGGLEKEDAWPHQLEKAINAAATASPPVRVLNGGVAGYSLTQVRVAAGEFAAILKPEVVVVGVLSSRYWRISDPYLFFHGLAVQGSEIPGITVTHGGLLRSPFERPWMKAIDAFMADHFHFGFHLARAARSRLQTGVGSPTSPSPAPRATDRLKPLLEEIERMDRIAEESGSRLVVLLINEQNADGTFSPVEKEYNEIVASFCERLRIPVVDPLPLLEAQAGGRPIFRQGSDFHWSAPAQRVAAEELARLLTGNPGR